METDNVILKEYSRFFDEQAQKTRNWQRTSLALPVALALLLILLLIWLKSALLVWGYISFLYAVTIWGLYRLRKAIKMTSDAAGHLQQIAQSLTDDPTREEFLTFVNSLRKPGDDSNVPEAIGGLAHGQISSGSLRVAANTAFATPISELRVAAFFRTGLILGGLFGTVLFFSLELTGQGILTGQLEELLLGLRGALASTLTGILGSIFIGIVASTIGRRLEELTWETEAFLSSSVSNVLLTTPVKRPIESESDLWESLREEVAHLSQRVQEMFKRMADDAHAYAISLQNLSQRLENLPAVQVPEQLANLEQVVTDFRHGAEVLGKTVPPLVETVGALGVFAPAKMLDNLEQLDQKVTEHQQHTAQSLEGLQQDVSSTNQQLKQLDQKVTEHQQHTSETLDGLQQGVSQTNHYLENYEERFDNLDSAAESLQNSAVGITRQLETTEQALHYLGYQVERVGRAVTEASEQTSQELAGLEDTTNQTLTISKHIGRYLGPIPDEIPPDQQPLRAEMEHLKTIFTLTREDVQNALTRINTTVETLDTLSENLSNSTEVLGNTSTKLQSQTEMLAVAASDLTDDQGLLNQLRNQLTALDQVIAWHQRAARAPLMRLLLVPLVPSFLRRKR